jgi:hypothetical protein
MMRALTLLLPICLIAACAQTGDQTRPPYLTPAQLRAQIIPPQEANPSSALQNIGDGLRSKADEIRAK